MRPVIALLSDFGSRDHYVGTMKGVMLGICPDVTFVDITHDIAPHDVLDGAIELAAAYRFFPPGTIFLAVVDPGVGSGRRGIAAEIGDYRFVCPDNGLLSAVLRETPPKKVVELTERRYARRLKQITDLFKTVWTTTFNGTIPQALMMFNGDLIKQATAIDKSSFLARIAASNMSAAAKIEYLFLAGLGLGLGFSGSVRVR